MTFDELQKTWTQQTVAGTPPVAAQLQRRLETEVRQRSRKILRVITVAMFVFVVAWVTAIAVHVTGIQRFTPVSLVIFILMTAFDVVFLVGAIRAYRRMKHEAASMGRTLLDATLSSLRAVEWQMRDCVRFGYVLAFAVVCQMAISTVRYYLGEARGSVALANVVFMTLIAMAVALTLRRYYRRELLLRRDDLRRELGEFGRDDQSSPSDL